MTTYINLDDPDVTYSHNVGNHEVYIIGSEAERIDLVRCGECRWHNEHKRCVNFDTYFNDDFYCAYGERRADDE